LIKSEIERFINGLLNGLWYTYIIAMFIALAIMLFGVRHEILTNQPFKDALFCENSQGNYTKYAIVEGAILENKTNDNKLCSTERQKKLEEVNGILPFIFLFIFLNIAFTIYKSKELQEKFMGDLRKFDKLLDKFRENK